MRLKFKHIYLVIFAAAIAYSASAIGADFKMSLDSVNLLMGRQTALTLTITDRADRSGRFVVPFDSVPAEIEFTERANLPETEITTQGSNKRYKAVYKIQSFDSGVWRIPPVMFISEGDTVYSNELSLKVSPVDVSDMKGLDPLPAPEDLGRHFFDFLPDFITDYWYWYIIGLVIIAGSVCAYLLATKKVKVNIMPKKKMRPPYEVAMEQLQKLKEEKLWETGREKAFYTRLTEILREYLEYRFGINAMEMTSSQIIKAVDNREDIAMSSNLMKQILEIADFVKFARVQPLREDNIKSFDAAVKFVEDTRPVETADENTDSKN